jgi:hypothetical protein
MLKVFVCRLKCVVHGFNWYFIFSLLYLIGKKSPNLQDLLALFCPLLLSRLLFRERTVLTMKNIVSITRPHR